MPGSVTKCLGYEGSASHFPPQLGHVHARIVGLRPVRGPPHLLEQLLCPIRRPQLRTRTSSRCHSVGVQPYVLAARRSSSTPAGSARRARPSGVAFAPRAKASSAAGMSSPTTWWNVPPRSSTRARRSASSLEEAEVSPSLRAMQTASTPPPAPFSASRAPRRVSVRPLGPAGQADDDPLARAPDRRHPVPAAIPAEVREPGTFVQASSSTRTTWGRRARTASRSISGKTPPRYSSSRRGPAPGRAASPRCGTGRGVRRTPTRSPCPARRGGAPRTAWRTSCRRPVPRPGGSEACRVPWLRGCTVTEL